MHSVVRHNIDMKKILGIMVLIFLWCSSSFANVETRVIGYQDDGTAAWFTFAYSKDDIFSLSFAGSGELPGIMITEGPILKPDKIKLNLLYDKNRSLQKKIKIEQLRRETS